MILKLFIAVGVAFSAVVSGLSGLDDERPLPEVEILDRKILASEMTICRDGRA